MTKNKEEVQEIEEQEDPVSLDTDFNLEDEFKADPLITTGNYFGNVISVTYDPAKYAILWTIALEGNLGEMSDGETPVDGSHQFYRNFLPKPGDESAVTSTGRGNKRQSKINMLTKFADGMGINMNSKEVILEALGNQDWVGIPVLCSIGLNEYMGTISNQVNKMVTAETN